MTEPFKFVKDLSSDFSERLLRVMAPAADGAGFHAMSFTAERIDYVTEISEGLSAIALKNGAKIPVALPYDTLEHRIYRCDDAMLDLRDVTGAAAKGAVVPDLATDFETAAAPAAPAPAPAGKKPFVDRELTIAIFVRQSEQQNFQMFFVKDSNINWAGVDGADGKNGKMTKLPLRSGKGPFGETTLLIDMQRSTFMDIYNLAKLDGQAELDLREQTRRKDPDAPKVKRLNAG